MKPSVRPQYFRSLALKRFLGLTLLAGQSIEAATIQKIIVSRQGIKGLAGVRFGSFGAPSINDTGSVAVYSTIYGKEVDSTTNAMVALINRTGTARKIVREGDDSSSGASLLALGQGPVINNSRHVSWTGEFIIVTNNQTTQWFTIALGLPSGSWVNYGGRNTAAYVNGMPVITMNNRNATAIAGLLYDSLSQSYLDAVFRLTRSAATAIVAAGETPIGLPLGSTYSSFGNPTVDDKNTLYYVADVSDAGNAFDGIWFGKNGDPDPLVIKGQTAPGTGSTYSTFSNSPSPSPDGRVCAFAASAGGTNNGIWLVDTSTKEITSLVTTSTPVNGTTETVTNIQPPSVNNNGQVAFLATSSVTSKTGIYGWNGSKLEKIIAPGDVVNIDGKDKNVIDIRFNPMRALNAKGEVVFTASFDDRTSGVFKASL